MNDRIKQLTENYLNSLNLSSWYSLNDSQKQKIIQINSQSEWIIFNASSLQSERIEAMNYAAASYIVVDERNRTHITRGSETTFMNVSDSRFREYLNIVGDYTFEIEKENIIDADGNIIRNPDGTPQKRPTGRRFVRGRVRNPDGSISGEHRLNHPGAERSYSFSPENFKITSSNLQSIIEETVKIYEPKSIESTDKIKNLAFTGGSGLNERGYKQSAIHTSYFDGKGEEDYWVAINKKELAKQYSSLCVASLNNSRRQWQENRGVDGLLNNQDIINSREKETETPPPNDPSAGTNHSTNTQTPPPSTTQTIQFTISQANQVFPDYFLFFLETNPFVVNGSTITKITR